MGRSAWKVPYIHSYLFSAFAKKRRRLRLWFRSSLIHKKLINRYLQIYNGKGFTTFLVKREMVGHKAGEFSLTKELGFRQKKKAKKKKGKRR